MKKELWGTMKGLGNLYLEEELVVGVETILFVCMDDSDKRYLFMTYDSYEGVYIYVQVSDENLIAMLKGQKPIEMIYRESSSIYKTSWGEESYISKKYDASTFEPDLLPPKDLVYSIKSEYIQDYIKKLQNLHILDDAYIPCARHENSLKKLRDDSYDIMAFNETFQYQRQEVSYIKASFDTIYNSAA